MKLRNAFLAALLLSPLLVSAAAAETPPPEPPSFVIEGRKVQFHGARVSEIAAGRTPEHSVRNLVERSARRSIPGVDRELRLSVTAEDFPTLPGVIGGMRRIEIVLPDGQSFRGKREGVSWGGKPPVIWDLASFPVVPWREKQVLLRFEYAAQQYEFPFENPGYREDVPEWQAEPYPVRWKQGELQVTLEGLQLVKTQHKRYTGSGWDLTGKWSIQWKGRPANDAFTVSSSLVEDAAGNRSTSCGLLGISGWRLHCSIVRNSGYPFEKDEIRWFGWTKADRIKTIPAGECDSLEIDAFGREAGLVFAGLFGAGTYEMENGRLISNALPGPEGPVEHFKSEFDDATGKLRLHVAKPTFVKQLRRNQKNGWHEICLDPEGKRVFVGGQHFSAGDTSVWGDNFWNGGDKSFQYGIAKFGKPTRFEMFVRPPALPGE